MVPDRMAEWAALYVELHGMGSTDKQWMKFSPRLDVNTRHLSGRL